MSITSFLFRLARLSADTKAVASGDPKQVARRTTPTVSTATTTGIMEGRHFDSNADSNAGE